MQFTCSKPGRPLLVTDVSYRHTVLSTSAKRGQDDWWFAARCRGKGNEVSFFPGQGHDHEPARAVCRACAVRGACLADALERRDPHGVWGGTVPEERKMANALQWDATKLIRFVDARRLRPVR